MPEVFPLESWRYESIGFAPVNAQKNRRKPEWLADGLEYLRFMLTVFF